MALDEAIRHLSRQLHADLEGGNGHWVLELTLAQRQAGSEMRHLRYRLSLDEEDGDAVVYFEDTLWERADHPGLDLGGALRAKEEAFLVAPASSGGLVEKQARHFEDRYATKLNFAAIRKRLAEAVKAEGYTLRHLIPLDGEMGSGAPTGEE